MDIRVILFAAALVCSCSEMVQEQQLSEKRISLNAVTPDTKTGIVGSSIHFETGDRLRLVCEGYNDFYVSNAKSESVNQFDGYYDATGQDGTDCDWYAVYPTVLQVNGSGVVSGTLPESQHAPFDPAANMMYSNIVTADYCEKNQPSLSFHMGQMMGLIRITFMNTNATYAGDYLKSVQISADGALSGSFEFDMHHPGVTFSDSTSGSVRAVYSKRVPLGLDVQHSVCLFVNPASLSNATLTIKTRKHSFTYTSTKTVTPKAGELTVLPLMDISDFLIEDIPYQKVVACWGNSYTSRNSIDKHDAPNEANYPDYLQTLLGDGWLVYNGGYNGMTQPFIIDKLKEWEEENDAELSILYMDRNGGFSSWQECLDQHYDAISHLTNPNDYIVLGGHLVDYWPEVGLYPRSHGDSRVKGGTTYEGTFLAPFKANGHYKDLYHPVVQDWKYWLVRVGKYNSVEEIDESVEYPGGADVPGAVMIDSDGDGIKDKALDWPQSFRWATNDLHPSKWGARAIALLVYDRMVELGYVD